MSLINVGIVGSCVSRDNFNSMFNAGYTRLFNIKLYINHITFPSLVSEKIDFNDEDIDLENADDITATKRELSRSFLKELENASDLDYLIIDFYSDIFYGIVMADNNIIFTDDYRQVTKTKFYSELENKKILTLLNDPEEYFEIWKESIHTFIKMINEIMPNVKIIINKSRAVKEYKDTKGNIKNIVIRKNIDVINEMWEKLDNYCIKTFGFQYMDLSAKDYISYEEHPWGSYHPVHYTKDFYENFMLELSSIAVNDVQKNLYKLLNYDETCMNLIDNSNFVYGKNHWSYWNDNFNITDNKVEINNNNTDETYNLLFSNPIKVKKGEVYNLSFKVYIDGNVEFDSHKIIFYLRLFKHPTKLIQADSVWFKNLKYYNYINEDVRNEWVTVKYMFKPETNGFLKVGPGIAKNGHVIWKDIYLTNGVADTNWKPSYNDVIRNKYESHEINVEKSVEKSMEPELPCEINSINEKLDKEQDLKIQIQNLSIEIQNLTSEIYEAHNQRKNEENRFKSKIDEYQNSKSWILTSPLRKISLTLKNLRK